MKIKSACKKCDSNKVKVLVTINPTDRDTYFKFSSQYKLDLIEKRDERAAQLFMPPSKYPKYAQAPLVIPNVSESPCIHCQFGEDTIGPRGCGRGDTCLALACHNFLAGSGVSNVTVKTFLKGTSNWDLPKKKYTKKAIGEPVKAGDFSADMLVAKTKKAKK
jgi:hypothetical protein